MKARTDYGTEADKYFQGLDESMRGLALALRATIIAALPDASETIKWGVPVYEKGGLVCAIRNSAQHIALQFYDAGITLDDPDRLLEGTGKRLRHVKIRDLSDIRKGLFKKWIKQAAAYNRK